MDDWIRDMNKRVKIGSGGIVTLTDRHYKAQGGEAAIYVNGGMVYKMYHDPDTKQLPLKKLQELAIITNPTVVTPKDIIFDAANGKPLGYTTTYIDDVDPLVMLFTRAYKNDKNISFRMINELVKQMQLVVADVHSAKCLIVDLNELNVLADVQPTIINPWFIDTDSYSTPSFKATAIMDSVRDRRVTTYDKQGQMHYHPDDMSDWFSFAILAFSLYTNIHPFRGSHPNYKPKDKPKQMDDGVSVFHPGVRVPPSVNDFKVIPARHLAWLKDVFLNNNRSVPPLPDSSAPLMVPTQIVTIRGTDKITVQEVAAYTDNIMAVYQMMGVYYVATKSRFYASKKEIGTHNAKKIALCSSSDGTLITAQQDGTNIVFTELTKGSTLGSTTGTDMFGRNGSIYTIGFGKLTEHTFESLGNKTIRTVKAVSSVADNSSKMFDGCVMQDLLGKLYLTLPYKQGHCFSKYVKELDGYRVVSAKSDKTVTIVLGEKKGQYDRIIIVFDKHYTKFDVRKEEDVSYDNINFAVMDNGLCALLSSPDELELFSTAFKFETLTDPPFDATMKMLATPDGLFFVNGNSLHQIKRK